MPAPKKRPEDLVRPTPEQVAWQDREIGMFFHFDLPIFTDLAECDVPLRDHDWFWHPGGEARLYPLERLLEVYHLSVGRNCNLLINAVIDREGRVPEADLRRFRELGDAIRRLYGKPLAETKGRGETVDLRLERPARIDRAVIQEEIAEGERVREYVPEALEGGAWKELAQGISIGHKRIERFPAVEAAALRLRVTEAVCEPLIRKLAAYAAE